ncbi:MAG: hypothetical protein LBE36_08385 [Flavobacteriaceae bacterium]|jgi:hypothetical protein|nr:hypothetical protein [Flavobacteriaceae bacterium]
MKKLFIMFISLATSVAAHTQTTPSGVGINTTKPAATLEVKAKEIIPPATIETPEGFIAPRLRLKDLEDAKTAGENRGSLYGEEQVGTMIYVTDIVTGSPIPEGQTINVTAIGYYYFDGIEWQMLRGAIPTNSGNSVSAANGISIIPVIQGDQVRLGGTLIEPTFITADAVNTLSIRGLQEAPETDSIVTVGTNGTLRQISLTRLRSIGPSIINVKTIPASSTPYNVNPVDYVLVAGPRSNGTPSPSSIINLPFAAENKGRVLKIVTVIGSTSGNISSSVQINAAIGDIIDSPASLGGYTGTIGSVPGSGTIGNGIAIELLSDGDNTWHVTALTQ